MDSDKVLQEEDVVLVENTEIDKTEEVEGQQEYVKNLYGKEIL